jgi:hypothetical protein
LVPLPFRPVVKRYLRLQVTRYSQSECAKRIYALRLFLEFYLSLHPDTRDFQHLSRADIENYLLWLKARTNGYTNKSLDPRTTHDTLGRLRHFLEYLERSSSPEATRIPVGKLIWSDDLGKKPQLNYNEVRYIPELVLFQLEQHMHELPAKYLPIVIILRASGWRIGDVLNLRYDTC